MQWLELIRKAQSNAMTEITNQTLTNASPHVRARAAQCVVEQVAPDEYAVEVDGTTKRIKLVQMGEQVFAICLDWRSGIPCEANDYKRECCHVIAVLKEFTKGLRQ